MRALMARPECGAATASGRAFPALVEELNRREIDVIPACDRADAEAVVQSDSLLVAMAPSKRHLAQVAPSISSGEGPWNS